MAFDFKKEYKEYYMLKNKLSIVEISKRNLRGTGNPNEENGYDLDITDTRYHHEIYLSNPRNCDASK